MLMSSSHSFPQIDFSQDEEWDRWAQVGLDKLRARDRNVAIQSSQVSAPVVSVNPYAALPMALAPPAAIVVDLLPPVTPAMHYRRQPLRERVLESALVLPNVQTNIALVTPAKQDEVTKKRKVTLKTVELATKRKTAVSASAVMNGAEALASEIRDNATLAPATLAPATLAPAAKKKKKTKEAAIDAPAVAPVVTGPPVPKCQGCIHCDLLELKVMEPKVVQHYLKRNQFLEHADCAGDCDQSIKLIHEASPKANIRYCDVNKKGFDAPDDDPSKASMECGLALCLACYGRKEEKYDAENKRGRRRRG